ncbi:MAG: tetratricopeptide repeat protein [Planctomycetes bacterium]|nr:tetratricopeptide repeat protein [Planctomycetota bacterium]
MVDEVEEFETHVTEYERVRDDGSLDAVARNRELIKVAQKLDKVYWDRTQKIVAKVVRASAGKEKLSFSPADRMIVDTGFLDPRLMGKEANMVKGQLVKELATDGERTHFYFSDWIAERFKWYLTVQEFEEEPAAETAGAEEPETLKKLREQRTKVYATVGVLFQQLPGVPPKVVEMVLTGKLDQHLEMVALNFRATKDPKLFEDGKKFTALKKGVIAKVKARITNPKQLAVIDVIAELDRRIWTEVVAFQGKRDQAGAAKKKTKSKGVEEEERINFLSAELRLVKQLIMLGVMQAGITKTHSVLTPHEERITKADVKEIVDHIRTCDAGLKVTPNVLIAPYKGTGFFEFDRDTMIVPLVPVRPKDEAIVDAVCAYRILIDTLHHEGKMKKTFESTFGAADFRGNFAKEYKNWIMKIGRGKRAQQDATAYEFFKTHVGPNPAKPIGPAELLQLSPEEGIKKIKEYRLAIKEGNDTFDHHYGLAVIYWTKRKFVEAYTHMNDAIQLNPSDGCALFSLGAILSTMDRQAKAVQAFQECVNIAQNTIWQVYAWEMIEKIK